MLVRVIGLELVILGALVGVIGTGLVISSALAEPETGKVAHKAVLKPIKLLKLLFLNLALFLKPLKLLISGLLIFLILLVIIVLA